MYELYPWRIHGAGILMLTLLGGFVDGIHGTPYIAATWILWDYKCMGQN